jgi:hypothetical protein
VRTTLLAPSGTFTEVAWFTGSWWATWQDGVQLRLVSWTVDLSRETSAQTFALGDGAGAFPRLLAWEDRLWLVYRLGGPSYAIRLVDALTGDARLLGYGYGNDPVALGAGFVAWQSTDDYQVLRQPLDGQGMTTYERRGAPTGLSRVLLGQIITVDEDRRAVPGGTRPCWVGDAVAIEVDETAGGPCDLVRRLTDGFEVRLFQGDESNTPRLATDGNGRYLLGTWGKQGVRIALIDPADFTAPVVEPPPVDPPPTPPVPPFPQPPKPPEPTMVTPQQIRDTLAAWPWDVDVDHLARFRDNVWKRDQGGDVPSRGALAFYHRGVGAAIAQQCIDLGRGLSGAAEWNAAFDKGTDDAIRAYKAQIGPGPEDPQ